MGTTCPSGFKRARIYSESQVKWLSYFFSEEAVRIENYHGKTLDPENFYNQGVKYPNVGDPSQKVLILQRNSAMQLYPGDYLPILGEDKQNIWVYGKKTNHLYTEETPAVNAVNVSGGWMFFTSNYYTPKLHGSKIDRNYFHSICDNICYGCYAAAYEQALDYTKDAKWNRDERVNFPAAAVFCDDTDDCRRNNREDALINDKFLVRAYPKHSPAPVPDKYWRKETPNMLCSDQGRYAVAFRKTGSAGGLENIPIFDRLRILCMMGEPPVQIPKLKCPKNSDKINGQCVCRKGYTDVMDAPELQNYLHGYGITKRGQAFLGKKSCNNHSNTEKIEMESIMFLIDGSYSIDGLLAPGLNPSIPTNYFLNHINWQQIKSMLLASKNWLPRDSRIWFKQYSNMESNIGHTGRSCSNSEYDEALKVAVESQKGGQTFTYTYWKKMLDYRRQVDGKYISYKRSLFIIVTDGQPTRGDREKNFNDIKIEMKRHNMKAKIIAVGKEFHGNYTSFDNDVDNIRNDVFTVQNYQDLEKSLKNVLISTHCDDYSEADLQEALSMNRK